MPVHRRLRVAIRMGERWLRGVWRYLRSLAIHALNDIKGGVMVSMRCTCSDLPSCR